METKQQGQTRILTMAEVAAILRVHRSTVSRLVKSGQLPSYKIGGRILFREDEVWEFFEKQATKK